MQNIPYGEKIDECKGERRFEEKSECVWVFQMCQGSIVSCNNLFIPMGQSPKEMGMKFCCFCGQNIKEK